MVVIEHIMPRLQQSLAEAALIDTVTLKGASCGFPAPLHMKHPLRIALARAPIEAPLP